MKVLVIGASRGIGLELVRQYIADGDAVHATARDEPGRQRLVALGAQPMTLDVADAASASALAWQLDGLAFDLVVFNAGIAGPRLPPLQAPDVELFDQVMRTNVLGPMQVLPQLADALAPGAVVVVVSSRMGSMGARVKADAGLYRASKAAVNSVLRDLAIVWAGRATCVALHPGWVRTDMGGVAADLDVADSVAGMRRVVAALTPADNGRFLNFDGSPLPW